MDLRGPLRVGVGGPVGSGKTALVERLCKKMRGEYDIAVVTNDIYTKEDERLLVAAQALAPERIMGVETGGCPHTAIREDASINLEAVARLTRRFPKLELVLIESGQRRRAIAELRDSEARLHDLYDNAPDMMLSISSQTGDVVECNFHNGQFDIRTGEVVSPPCMIAVKTYPAVVEGGAVFIDVD